MKVFLTGATGFIGQALTRQIIEKGWDIKALVRNPQSPQAQVIQSLGVKLIEGDILNLDSMRDAMEGVDIVIHNAGAYEFGVDAKSKKQMYDINVTGTDNVLSLALELNIARTIYISTVWVFGATGTTQIDETHKRTQPYLSYYEETKTLAHEVAVQHQDNGLSLLIVCPNGVIGPNDSSMFGYYLRMYLNRLSTPVAWASNSVLSTIHVDDLVKGITLVAEKGATGETYILSGEPLSKRAILDLWATRPGGFKVRLYLPTNIATFIFAPMALILRLLGLPAFISWEGVKVGGADLYTSSKKAQDELGWTHRSAQQAWFDILDAEIELRNQRTQRDILSMLKPIPHYNPNDR
jgi:nucleoside-diphosphate-sugar epimerase